LLHDTTVHINCTSGKDTGLIPFLVAIYECQKADVPPSLWHMVHCKVGPTVTLSAAEHHRALTVTKLCCSVTVTHVCICMHA